MAFFLVDMEFREKAKQLLTSREIFAIFFFLVFAMVPWVEVLNDDLLFDYPSHHCIVKVMDIVRNVGNSTMRMMDEAGAQVLLSQLKE